MENLKFDSWFGDFKSIHPSLEENCKWVVWEPEFLTPVLVGGDSSCFLFWKENDLFWKTNFEKNQSRQFVLLNKQKIMEKSVRTRVFQARASSWAAIPPVFSFGEREGFRFENGFLKVIRVASLFY